MMALSSYNCEYCNSEKKKEKYNWCGCNCSHDTDVGIILHSIV